MKRIRLVIIGASEIAYRRFMPALLKDARFEYVGVAIEREQDVEKANCFLEDYGGEIIHSYDEAISRKDVDAVYVPQPPALHFGFGKRILETGKHLFMEKPFTIKYEDSKHLIELAKEKNLAVIENYMFRFHKQIKAFINLSKENNIVGKINKFEVRFSFPQRSINDFRYNKALGGGALFDCGGYTIMMSDILLDRKGLLVSFEPEYTSDFEVDIGGKGVFQSNDCTCEFSFGMAHPYNCYAKAYGDRGTLVAPRVLTAPSEFDVVFEILDNDSNLTKTIDIGADDTFLKSIDNFYNCIINDDTRRENYALIMRQSKIIEEISKLLK